MYDILIRGALVADGSGCPAYKADIAVKDGLIAKIAPTIEETAARVLEAQGLVAAPGFIDNHSHSDESALTGSGSCNYLEQGVTTQVTGQCGTSPAPYADGNMDATKARLSEEEFAVLAEKAETPASFMQAAEETARAEGLGTNYAFFIGHGALRAKAMGYSDAKPTEAQMNCMKENLKQAMEAGFLGYSSGLVYAPSVYGDALELTELAKVMAPYNGIYASHIRSEGDRELAAVQEAISVGEGAGCKVLISHFKVIGMHNEGRSAQLLAALDQAWEKGVQVYADQYPYTAGSAPLLAQIPPKYLVGGTAEALKRLKDPQLRKEILHSILHETEEFDGGIYYGGFELVLVVEARKTPQLENKTLAQIAEEQGKEPMDAYCDLLLENDGIAQGVYFTQVPSDMIRLMADSRVFCGSDWSDFAAPVDPNTEGGSHPRAVSTTVRRLELVRDFRLRTMEESIKNITYDTAQAMGLTGIGLLKEGWPADIAVIDYDALHARADFVHPYRRNDGVHYVLVSGKLAVENGTVTGVRAGRILKRG